MLQSCLKIRTTCIIITRGTSTIIQKYTWSYEKDIRRRFNDGIDLQQQTVEINSIERIRRCSFYKDVDLWSFYKTTYPSVRTLGDALNQGYIASNDGPCVGFFPSSDDTKPLQTLSYSAVIERSRLLGSYLWKRVELIPLQSKVAILSSNRPEYFFFEQACYMYGFIVISLYTTYDCATIQNVLQRTQPEVLIVDNLERIEQFKDELLNSKQIREIIVLDDNNHDQNGKIRSFSNIIKSMKFADFCERPSIDPDSIATFVLTSGTTGEPKIAMISNENLLATAKGYIIRLDRANIVKPMTDRHCSFLPMAHIYERFVLLQCLLRGTQIAFCPAPEKLLYYLSVVKPTQATVVPRVLNKIYDGVMSEVNKSKIKRFLVQQALRERLPFLSNFIFRKIRYLFGNELMGMITGAAPIARDVLHFFRIAVNIPIGEGYGQTESAGAGTSTHTIDMSCGTIGTPIPTVEIKLIDVPGTTYRSEINQGEICIRGPTVFKGYLDDDEKTREILDADGWLHTGDVGEWTNNGTLRMIDRTKNIFKLNQGKYIAPERLEDVYIQSPWIGQIFVDGISYESTVVAIVIPNEEYVRKNFQLIDANTTFVDLCQNYKLKEIILTDLNRLAKKYKLATYEIPSNIYLHSELFSQSNGLLTVTLKTRRSNARKQFQAIISRLYETDPTVAIQFLQN